MAEPMQGHGVSSRRRGRRVGRYQGQASGRVLAILAATFVALPTSAAWGSPAAAGETSGNVVQALDLTHLSIRSVEPTVTLDSVLSGFIAMMASAGGKVWATSYYRGGLASIEPATNLVTLLSTDEAGDIAGAESTVVRTAFGSASVEKWAADTGRLEWTVHSDSPSGAAVVGDEIWVANHNAGTVSILSASDGRLLDRVTVGPVGDSGPAMPSLAGGRVWVTDFRIHKVIGIDVATHRVVARIPVPAAVKFCDSPSVAVDDALWISDCSTHVTKVDLDALTAVTVDAGTYVSAPLAVGHQVWVPVGGELLVHLNGDLEADRAVSIPGRLDFGGVVVGDSAWINVGFGSLVRLESPETW